MNNISLQEKEPNHVFWARVIKNHNKTKRVEISDCDEFFPRAEIEMELLEKQLYVSGKVREKKLIARDFDIENQKIEIIKKWGL